MYFLSLRRIAAFKEKYPEAHAAYRDVILKVSNGITRTFLDTPAVKYDDTLAIRAHAAIGALRTVDDILKKPAAFLPKPKKVTPVEAVRAGLDTILRAARDRLRPKTPDKEV